MKTTIFNDTSQVFFMHRANALGIYSIEYRLGPRERIMVDADPNPTYREFELKDEANDSLFPGRVIITSDDLADSAAITFYMTPEGSVSWRGIKKRASHPIRQVFICIHTPHCMYNGVQ